MTKLNRRNFITHSNEAQYEKGFTLIELSIVLVIIGLIVGGVLVGQDLIKSAETRATITQVEKFNTAVNTFRGKFNAIPGDATADVAGTFGLNSPTRAATAGQGDGNGLIDGEAGAGSFLQGGGETGMFWNDLSSAAGGNLVGGSFPTAAPTGTPSATGTQISQYMPAAKLGGGRYFYVYENAGSNYYGLSGVSALASGVMTSAGTVSVIQAYNMDKKTDDGFPTTGNVIASYITGGAVTASNLSAAGTGTTDCYGTTAGTYSTTVSNGNGSNCGLSFRFQ